MSNRVTTTTPILFSSDFMTITDRAVVTPDMSKYTSIFRRPTLVDEIRFTFMWKAANFQSLASSIRCKLNLGRYKLTSTRDGGTTGGGSDFVPIWNFGPALQQTNVVEGVLDQSSTGNNVTLGHFRWRLPKPLYMPAGQTLTPQFYRRDALGGSAYINIAIAGRQLGEADREPPKTIAVPFVTYWEPPLLATTGISMSLDLFNPFLVPLNVQRFVGRQYTQDGNNRGEDYLFTGIPGTICNVVQADSWGNEIVGDSTDMGSVYDYITRTWTFNRVLNAKERYVVNILNNFVTNSAQFALPEISMVGWREEVLT